MARILTFKHPDNEPHAYGWLACTSCGFVSMHTWPAELEPCDLECGECGEFGHAEVWNRDTLLPMNEEWRAEIEAEGVRGEDE